MIISQNTGNYPFVWTVDSIYQCSKEWYRHHWICKWVPFLSFFFFLNGHTWSIWKFLGQGFKLNLNCDLCHTCDNARSLTHWAPPRDQTWASAVSQVTTVRSLCHSWNSGGTFLYISQSPRLLFWLILVQLSISASLSYCFKTSFYLLFLLPVTDSRVFHCKVQPTDTAK